MSASLDHIVRREVTWSKLNGPRNPDRSLAETVAGPVVVRNVRPTRAPALTVSRTIPVPYTPAKASSVGHRTPCRSCGKNRK